MGEQAAALRVRRLVVGHEVEAVHDDVGHVDVEEAGSGAAEDGAPPGGEPHLEAHLDPVGEHEGVGPLEHFLAGARDLDVAAGAGVGGVVENTGQVVGGRQAGLGRGEGLVRQAHA